MRYLKCLFMCKIGFGDKSQFKYFRVWKSLGLALYMTKWCLWKYV